jgi:hypothetical protein
MRFVIPILAATAMLASPCLAQDPPDDFIYAPVNEDALRTVASGGFGDRANSWAASMQWFKGDLYVGTSRAAQCVTLASMASRLPVDLYPLLSAACPADAADLPLAAEIWRYRPSSARWDRVYRSPLDVAVRFDAQKRPTKFTARDIAFRSMTVVKEPGGHEALYVGGMSAAEVFPSVFAAMPAPPPARVLRTRDGSSWQAVPQAPGTLLGDLGKGLPGSQIKPVVFDALVGFRGRLFAAVGDSLGNNVILASSDPASGDDAWQVASPLPETFPVSALAVYNDMLYCAVMGRQGQPYRIFKADAAGPAPLTFAPVMTGGGSDPSAVAWRAVSLVEFKGRLYVGTGTPPELVRIDADDSWELLVGAPRTTDAGLKRPLGGVTFGLGSAFSAQFRALTVHEGKLYLGTSDWSQILEALPPLGEAAQFEFGFDLFRSDDGISWTSITRTGLGADHQPIVQSMQSTPAGLFVGSASSTVGAQVWQKDATAAAAAAAPPERMEAVSEELGDDAVILSWEPAPGATQYWVYRSTVTPLFDIIGGQVDPGPLLEMLQGACDAVPLVCGLLNALQSDVGVPSPFVLVGTTTDRFLVDERASTLPALYFVRAQDGAGGLSLISNMAGGPSRAALITFPGVGARLDAANEQQPSKSRTRIGKLVRRAMLAGREGNAPGSERLLDAAEKGLKQGPLAQRISATEVQDLTYFLHGLRRNVWLGEQDLIPLDAVLDGIP